MRLLKLSANQPGFKTLAFNRQGLSLIVGKAKESTDKPEVADAKEPKKRTYNGVGKSLAIYLIHFCLGATKNPKLATELPGWSFTLELELDGQPQTITRSTEDQDLIVWNGQHTDVADFNVEMGRLVFGLNNKQPSLSFRSLITRFIRPKKFSYLHWDKVDEKEKKDWEILLRNGYLFGIPPEIITAKYETRIEQQETQKLFKTIEGDDELARQFHEGSDARIQRRDLEDQINKLERHLASFEIAEDYAEVKQAVGVTKRRLDEIALDLSGIDERLAHLEASLELGADLPRERVIRLFDEANIVLAKSTQRTLAELENFHQRLLEDRRYRLRSEQEILVRKRTALLGEQSTLSARRAEQLRYLDHHGALADHVALSEKLSDLRSRLSRLLTHAEMVSHYKERATQLKAKLSTLNLETNQFLSRFETTLDANLDLFRSISSAFYENKPGGITLTANEGENQLRFDMKVAIDDDSADGIGQVKIFCYDATILLARHHHHIDFLVHDGRLFTGMAPNQRAILFQQVHALAQDHGIQYIANINQDHLESIRDVMGNVAFEELFGAESVILELTDESDSSKLLGQKISLDYDS